MVLSFYSLENTGSCWIFLHIFCYIFSCPFFLFVCYCFFLPSMPKLQEHLNCIRKWPFAARACDNIIRNIIMWRGFGDNMNGTGAHLAVKGGHNSTHSEDMCWRCVGFSNWQFSGYFSIIGISPGSFPQKTCHSLAWLYCFPCQSL